MKTIISIYDNHSKALDALKILREAGLPSKNMSLIGSAYEDKEMTDNATDMSLAAKGVGIGALAGSSLGLLTGLGLLAVPGFGFLFGMGALAGAIAGLDMGIIGGGVISALAIGGLKKDELEKKYQTDLDAGKILLIFQGNASDADKAAEVLAAHGIHTELGVHDH